MQAFGLTTENMRDLSDGYHISTSDIEVMEGRYKTEVEIHDIEICKYKESGYVM